LDTEVEVLTVDECVVAFGLGCSLFRGFWSGSKRSLHNYSVSFRGVMYARLVGPVVSQLVARVIIVATHPDKFCLALFI
jgi:hypothetical protein